MYNITNRLFQAKNDANTLTGNSGKILTEIDNLVLEVVGKRSATVVGLPNVPERSSVPSNDIQQGFVEQLEGTSANSCSVYTTPIRPAAKRRLQRDSSPSSKRSTKELYYEALLHKCNLEILEMEEKMELPKIFSAKSGILEYYSLE